MTLLSPGTGQAGTLQTKAPYRNDNSPLSEIADQAYQATARSNLGIPVFPLLDMWLFSGVTSDTPTPVTLRLNHATPASATAVYVNEQGVAGVSAADMALYFSAININDVLEVRMSGSTSLAAVYARYRVTSVTDNGSWWTFGVAYIDGSGTFTGGLYCTLSVFPHNGVSATATGVIHVQNGATPSNAVGNNGDWIRCFNGTDDVTDRASGYVLFGPKAGGVWPAKPAIILPSFPTLHSGGWSKDVGTSGNNIVQPPSFSIECTAAAPTTAMFADILGTWTAAASKFYTSAAINWGCAGQRSVPGSSYQLPPGVVQAGSIKVDTLPSEANSSVGVGTFYAGVTSGHGAYIDSAGRFGIGTISHINNGVDTNYIARTAGGTAVAGDYVGFVRNGPLFTARLFDGSTKALKSELQYVFVGFSFDIGWSAGTGLFMCRSTTARLSYFSGIG